MEEDIKILEKFLCTSNLSFGDATRCALALRRIKDRYRELEEKILELNKEMTDFSDCWVHIDKIKEKIEEVNKSLGYSPVNKILIEQVLQELMEGK